MPTLDDHRNSVAKASQDLVRLGIMTKSNHGNVSLRLPGEDRFFLTSGGTLANMRAEDIALFDLEGNLIEGMVTPVGAEIIQMHAIVYRTRPDMGGVVHTHSPFATGFAVAGQAMPMAYEAMARAEMFDGVPVAGYGPRGSQQSVDNIETVLKGHDGIRALLLENHGVLAFGPDVQAAVRSNMVVEESAEILLNAMKLGGPKLIPREMVVATRERAASFAQAGTYSSETPRP